MKAGYRVERKPSVWWCVGTGAHQWVAQGEQRAGGEPLVPLREGIGLSFLLTCPRGKVLVWKEDAGRVI